jgi:NADPH-dependent glutamate synthase beta subunit-like oxidoreductase
VEAKTSVEAQRQPEQLEKAPPCRTNCPAGADVRGWLTTIAQRRRLGISDAEAYALAWRAIVDVNPFPAVMGRICPHPCEAGCNRIGKDEAVSINQMERFIGDWALRAGLPLQRLEPGDKTESIGVIGAGPAGLSFAYQMARRGYRVTVYEGYPKAGGMLRYGIPVYRLPEDVLDAEIQRILDLGVELKLATRVGRDIGFERLESRHDIVFLGIGAHKGRLLAVPGEDGPGLWTGTEYLSRINRGETVRLGHKVAVIGGGNTAVDAARAARRRSAEVTILYRRTRAEMPAIEREIDEALEEGIRIEYLVAPLEIVRNGEALESLVLQKMELSAPDDSGRRRPVPVVGSEQRFPVDSVIAAIAQEPDWSGLEAYHLDGDESIAERLGEVGGRVWAGGDVVGLGIASAAIANGRRAAEAAHARLRGLPEPVLAEPDPVGIGPVKMEYYPERPRLQSPTRPVSEWLEDPDAEIHLGITEEQFLEEAARCLSCGQCFGCEQCWMYCPHTCFTRLEDVSPGMYFATALDNCQACGKCIDICPCGFLQIRSDQASAVALDPNPLEVGIGLRDASAENIAERTLVRIAKNRKILSDLSSFVLRRPAIPTLVDFLSAADREDYSQRIIQRLGISVEKYAILNIHKIGVRAPVAFVFEELRRWNGGSSWWPNHLAAFERDGGGLERVRVFFLGRKKRPLVLPIPFFGLNAVPLFELRSLTIRDVPEAADYDNARYLLFECRGGYPIGILGCYVRSPIADLEEDERSQFFFAVGFNFYGKEDWPKRHAINSVWEMVHNRVTANVLNTFKKECEAKFEEFLAGKRPSPRSLC